MQQGSTVNFIYACLKTCRTEFVIRQHKRPVLGHLQLHIMETETVQYAWVTGTLTPKDRKDAEVSNSYSQTYLNLCKHCTNLI